MMKIKEWKNKIVLTLLYGAILFVLWRLRMPCLFEHFLKIPCPGCGMSWAMYLACHLDFAGAFASHSMFWSMPILYLYFLLDVRKLKHKKWHIFILILIGIGFLANWIIKLC